MGKIHPLVGSTRVYTSPAKHGHGYRAFGFVRKLPDDRGMVSSSISGYVMLSTGMVSVSYTHLTLPTTPYV